MEDCMKKHFFEMSQASGVLVYVVDQDEPVYLKFTNAIRIQILFDSNLNPDAAGLCGDPLVLHTKSQYVNDVVGPCLNSEAAKTDSQHNANDKVSFDRSKLVTEPETKTAEIKRKQNKSFKSMLKPVKVQIGVAGDMCQQEGSGVAGQMCQLEGSGFAGQMCQQEDSGVAGQMCQQEGSGIADDICQQEGSEKYQLVLRNRRNCSGKVANSIKNKIIIRRNKRKAKVLVKIKKQKRLPEQSHDIDSIAINKPVVQKGLTSKRLKEKAIKCDYCEVEFSNQSDFYNHRRAEESKQTCDICGKVEPYQAHMIVHMQKHKAESSGLGNTSSEMDATLEESNTVASSGSVNKKYKKVRMKCNVCDLVLSSMDSLKIHTMLHTGESAYKCCVCAEKFPSLSTRQHHMGTHMSLQRFMCKPCGQRFQSRAELAKHQLTHEVKCALCGEIFPNKTSRSCHYRVSHAGDILKCTLCSNMFGTEEDLNKHMLYHRKGRKEQCPVCGVVVLKLKDHMLMHSQQANEKMFVCDQCPMSYLRKSNLDRHMRTHTGEKPYACNVCTKWFRSNGMLRKHLLTHTKEQPYQCEVCGKRCALRSNLNIHMRVHNSNRNYPCTLCSQTFNYKNSLHGHMKSKHFKAVSSHPVQQEAHHPIDQMEMSHLMGEVEEAPRSRLITMGLSSSLGQDLLEKSDDNVLVPHQQDYHDMHMHLTYSSNMNNVSANMLLDSERMPLLKYDMLPQNNTNHGF